MNFKLINFKMEDSIKFNYIHKINLTLPKKSKQKKLIKVNNKETPKISDIKSKKNAKNGKKKIETNKSINNGNNNYKFNKRDIKNNTLEKINKKYYELINRIIEDKKDLQKLDKIYNTLLLKTEISYNQSYIEQSIRNLSRRNFSKNKKNNNHFINNYNILKKDNQYLFDSIKSYNYINMKEPKIENYVNQSKELNLLKSKKYDKNETKKISFNKFMPNLDKRNQDSEKEINNYISVNQNNNISKYKTEKLMKKGVSNNILDNKCVANYEKINVNKNKKNKIYLNLRNIMNSVKVEKKHDITPKQTFFFINNEIRRNEKNSNIEEYPSRNLKNKKNNFNINNIQINSSASSVNYSPKNFYHNINHFKPLDNYINVQKPNKFNNKRNNEDNNINIIKKENFENNINNKGNLKNVFNIKDKLEQDVNKKQNISLTYLERNTISYLNNHERNETNDAQAFTLNELFSRENLTNNLNKYKENIMKYNSIKDTPRNLIYQLTENNNENKGEKLYKKIKLPFNENNKNQKKINVNNKIISFNNNNKDIGNKNETNNKIENPNIYFNKSKLYNKSNPKISKITDFYNKNLIVNNNSKENQSTISSKVSYIDYNIANLSSIKKTENNNNLIQKNRVISSSKKKLSNSFNKENNSNQIQRINKFNNNIQEINIKNNDKRINTLLSSEDKNKIQKNDIEINSNQYAQIINRLNSFENILDFDSKNIDKGQIENLIFCNFNTEKNIPLENKIYIKPLQRSQPKNKKENYERKQLYKKKRSQNNLTSIKVKNNESIELKNQESNNIHYIKKTINPKKEKNLNDIYSNNQFKLKYENNGKNIDNLNIQDNKDNQDNQDINNSKNMDISSYYIFDKNNIHCFYTKLYNFYMKVPMKTICFINKINKNTKNKNNLSKIKKKSSFNINKNKEIKLENIKFNGKNIISKFDNSNFSCKNKRINGSKEFNLELNEKEENKSNLNELNINNNIKAEKKNIKDRNQNKNIQIVVDDNICKNNNKNELYQNFVNYSTSKIKNNLYNNTENNELPKHIKICLATKKLSNILLTKNDYEIIPKKRSITEEKFALGCSKLNNIFKNKCSKNLNKNKITNINSIKIQNILNKNEDEKSDIETNNQIKINQKPYIYKTKTNNNLTEVKQFDNEKLKNNKKFLTKAKIEEIKRKIIKLLNILNINNLNEKLSEAILFKDFDKLDEKEIIMINNIFEKIVNDKGELNIYYDICKKINNILLNDNKNNIYNNQKAIIINELIQEAYKGINDLKNFNSIKIKSEKQYINIISTIYGLMNFIFELILSKLITKEESCKIIQKIIDECHEYERKIKYILLKVIIYLSEQYNNNLDNSKEGIILENLFKNKLKITLQDKNNSNNIKLYSIIEKLFENPHNDSYGFNEFNLNTDEKYRNNKKLLNKIFNEKLNSNLIKNLKNYRINKININTETNRDENGGIQSKIINKNNTEEISFKIDKNDKKEKKDINIQISTEFIRTHKNYASYENLYSKLNDNKPQINNIIYDSNKKPEHKLSTKKKQHHKKKSKSSNINLESENDEKKEFNLIINEKEKIIYDAIQKDLDDYFNYLLKKGIKSKSELSNEINYSYNWELIDDLIIVKKIKLEEIIKIIIEIYKNKEIINDDVFKINEYIKTIIEYYSNNLSDNQINIFRLNMIEIFMGVDDIVRNNNNSEILFEIFGNLLFVLLKNRLYYVKDLNNFIDKKKETHINICKVAKYTIISSGIFSKQYINDFKYTKLFNKSELFEKYVLNELNKK